VVALAALGWVMSDGPRAQRFLDLTGLTPDTLRQAIGDASTHRAVLDFLCAHEPDLLGASESLGMKPADLVLARDRLGA
jgi:hypothetical protein